MADTTRTATKAMKEEWLSKILTHFLHITFTDAATREMAERIAGKCLYRGLEIDLSQIPALTFNAMDMDMLRKFYKEIGYAVKPTVIDVNPIREADKVLPMVTGENQVTGLNYSIPVSMNMGRGGAMGALPIALSTFSVIKSNQIDVNAPGAFEKVKDALQEEGIYKKMTDESVRELMSKYDEYNEILRTEGLITFADQEPIGIRIMDLHPDYLNSLGFWHVVIDEFQDSNDINMEFVRRLQACRDVHGGTIKSILVIGDSDQSIYGFRNAVVENITHFDDKLGGNEEVDHFSLVNNYRSRSEIIDLANKFVAKNEERLVKPLVAAKGPGGKVVIKGFSDWEKELEYALAEADKIREEHPEWQICFMTRNKKNLGNMSQALSKHGITWVMMAPVKYIENCRVLAAMSLFESFSDPDATQGYYDYLTVVNDNKFRDFDDETKRQMMDDLRNEIISLKNKKPFTQRQKMHELLDALDKDDEVYIKWKEMMYQEALVGCEKEQNLMREPHYLNDSIRKFGLLGKSCEVKMDRSYEGDILITSHSSKGLEYDVVFLLADDFDAPMYHKSRKDIKAEVEEERRLLFVAMTRAKEALYVTGSYVCYSNEMDGDIYNQFLKELYETRDGDTKVWEAECLAYKQEEARKLQERKQANNKKAREKRAAQKEELLKALATGENVSGKIQGRAKTKIIDGVVVTNVMAPPVKPKGAKGKRKIASAKTV